MAFWLFAALFVTVLVLLALLGKALSPSRPSPAKKSTYECGQAPSGKAHEFMMTGANRYFLYAVVFFFLEASALVLLTSATVVTSSPEIALLVGAYASVVVAIVGYLMMSLKRGGS